jgi:hypothetical protein
LLLGALVASQVLIGGLADRLLAWRRYYNPGETASGRPPTEAEQAAAANPNVTVLR